MMREVSRGLAALLTGAVLGLVLATTPAWAEGRHTDDEDEGHSAIVWVGTVMTNIVYIPAKVLYAGVGGFVGCLGWLVTGLDVDRANAIWIPTTQGDYVVRPSMLDSDDEVHFIAGD